MCAENYQNRDRFDKDIAKIKQGSFFASHGTTVHTAYTVRVGQKTLHSLQLGFSTSISGT